MTQRRTFEAKLRYFSEHLEAASRKFSPEFVNRQDNVVVFPPQLQQILEIELNLVQQRILAGAG